MRQYRVATRQGHPVPSQVSPARGPFPPELYRHTEIVYDYEPAVPEFPPGATAQNNFQPERLLTCRLCLAEVYESQTPNHVCEETA